MYIHVCIYMFIYLCIYIYIYAGAGFALAGGSQDMSATSSPAAAPPGK